MRDNYVGIEDIVLKVYELQYQADYHLKQHYKEYGFFRHGVHSLLSDFITAVSKPYTEYLKKYEECENVRQKLAISLLKKGYYFYCVEDEGIINLRIDKKWHRIPFQVNRHQRCAPTLSLL